MQGRGTEANARAVSSICIPYPNLPVVCYDCRLSSSYYSATNPRQSMPEPIISVSGLRGIIGQSLTPEVALRYVAAFAASLPDGPVVITRDGRHTGPMLAEVVRAALLASGHSCLDAGVAATPTTGILVRHQRAVGGIQISASHNPPEYNGLKLFDHTGRVIPAEAGQQVIDRYRSIGASLETVRQPWPMPRAGRQHLGPPGDDHGHL